MKTEWLQADDAYWRRTPRIPSVRQVLAVAAVLLLLLTACGRGTVAASSEEAVRLHLQYQNGQTSFAPLLNSQLEPNLALVLFDDPALHESGGFDPRRDVRLSYAFVQRQGDDWRIDECCKIGGFSKSNERVSGKHISFDITHREGYLLLYGQVLTPSVDWVHVTFDDGHVHQQRPFDGVFAVPRKGALSVCRIRILVADTAMLEELYPNGAGCGEESGL